MVVTPAESDQVREVVWCAALVDGDDVVDHQRGGAGSISERRAELEALDLNGVYWQAPETFDDGESLFNAVCEHELEGVVAKRKGSRYRPAERGWVKIKNRDYWRYDMERESAMKSRRTRMFV